MWRNACYLNSNSCESLIKTHLTFIYPRSKYFHPHFAQNYFHHKRKRKKNVSHFNFSLTVSCFKSIYKYFHIENTDTQNEANPILIIKVAFEAFMVFIESHREIEMKFFCDIFKLSKVEWNEKLLIRWLASWKDGFVFMLIFLNLWNNVEEILEI